MRRIEVSHADLRHAFTRQPTSRRAVNYLDTLTGQIATVFTESFDDALRAFVRANEDRYVEIPPCGGMPTERTDDAISRWRDTIRETHQVEIEST